ncbi:MAG: DUF5104 domain-containing protein [Butyrivibrio sp.]|nr:DUF5104 domain-containing protein [Butyrivibrio sp.]
MNKKICMCLIMVLLSACSFNKFDIAYNRHLSKIEAFFSYESYTKEICGQLIETIDSKDSARLEESMAESVINVDVTKITAEEFVDYFDGKITSVEKIGHRISKTNGGLFGKKYNISLYESFYVNTNSSKYILCYAYCLCDVEEEKEGIQSLGVCLVEDYDNGGRLFTGIPGIYICTEENKEDIQALAKEYGAVK